MYEPEAFSVRKVAGVKNGVIGVGSQATAASLAPATAAGLDFGNRAVAVNRVAGQLANGSPRTAFSWVL